MNTLRFDHIAIPISNPTAARELFEGVLGLPLVAAYSGADWSGSPWLMMIYGLAEGQIALCAVAGKKPPAKTAEDLPHYAFSVRDAGLLEEWRRKLSRAAYAVRDEDHGEQQSIYFEDRDGATWEITAPPSRNVVQGEPEAVINRWIGEHGPTRGGKHGASA